MLSDARREIPAYAGMTGVGSGNVTGWGRREWRNAKAQGRNEKQAGRTGGGAGHDGDGAGSLERNTAPMED